MKKMISSIVLLALLIGMAGIGMASENTQTRQQQLGLPENAVEVAPGVFYLGESTKDGKIIEGYAFIHKMESATTSKQAIDDTADIYKFLPFEVKWADTMTYELNPYEYTSDETKINEIKNSIKESLMTWNNELPETAPLFDVTLELVDNSSRISGDMVNTIKWGNLGTTGTIAMNSFWYSPATAEIIESDVTFNTNYGWATSNVCSNQMDLQGIATHEFGHNGLSDLYMKKASALTMYGYSGFCDTEKRTLGTGDISGIVALYGA